jgi:uroporphyrinogen III methyltransferase/synthase
VRVVVTRPHEQAAELVSRIERLGHEVVVCPLIEIEPVGPAEVDASGYDWVIVTSVNGARQLGERLRGGPARIAAIGPGTASALRSRGLEPDLVPVVSTQEGLLAELPRPAGRVLFTAAEGARRLIADELGADVIPLYRTVELRPADFPPADLVVLASASAARAYAALGRSAGAISIGPQTSVVARHLGVPIVGEAATHSLDGLVAAVAAVELRAADPRARPGK